MQWVPVKSRMLLSVAYNDEWQQLYLKYRSGDIYCYRGVPRQRFEELLEAGSKGQYCRRHILKHYPYQRIHTAIPAAS
jgi:KTSC domain